MACAFACRRKRAPLFVEGNKATSSQLHTCICLFIVKLAEEHLPDVRYIVKSTVETPKVMHDANGHHVGGN
jgi:hypothetical protein